MTDLKILHINNDCTGCGSCVSRCPKGCLQLKPDKEGFYYPSYEPSSCVNCHQCEKACHIIHDLPKRVSKNVFMYYSPLDSVREKSSSGGVFSIFADFVMSKKGIVYGSAYNSKEERLCVSSTETESLDNLRKSKYIESFAGESFRSVRNNLLAGRHVLFCGTPCQVYGLKRYLITSKAPQDNLITIDFVCHGVPSNLCFTEFKRSIESKNKKIEKIDFRYKDFLINNHGWHNHVMKVVYETKQKDIIEDRYVYLYYKPFIDNLMLRKSCYTCQRSEFSVADFTIGDFWDINKFKPELDDNKGISCVRVNNEEKISIWQDISSSGYCDIIPWKIVEGQYLSKQKDSFLKEREAFFRMINKRGYVNSVMAHYGYWFLYKNLYWYPLKRKIKKILNKMQ